jgi:DNA helicase-2/ATP-dependent DNA helicase PcrA
MAERSYVREAARKNVYTGKTYNSVENISQFFTDRQKTAAPVTPSPQQNRGVQGTVQQTARPAMTQPKKKPFGSGSTVNHPKYGRGTVLRIEGSGDDAKWTISFAGYGLKKLVAKYAGIKIDE